VKKALANITALCAAFLVSCAIKPAEVNPERVASVASVIAEAKFLQALANSQGIEVPASVNSLISSAEKKNGELQTEEALILADKAMLQLQFCLLKKETESLATENKAAMDNLEYLEATLKAYQNLLRERKGMPKEQVIL
jgi:flagellar motor protein MotB